MCAIPASIAGGIPACLAAGGGVLSQHALQVVSQHALQQGGSAPGGGGLLWGAMLGDPPPLPKADGYCCGRYASYWNAFLLIV